MMLKSYMAASVASENFPSDKHLTLSFCDLKATSKFSMKTMMNLFPCKGFVVDVVYWSKPDVTVALVASENIIKAHEYCQSVGFDYNHEFNPHITLDRGNKTEMFSHLICSEVEFDDVYLRQKDFEK